MRARNITLRVVNLGPIVYGSTKFDSTPFGGIIAGILLRSTPGSFIGSMAEQTEKMNGFSALQFTRKKMKYITSKVRGSEFNREYSIDQGSGLAQKLAMRSMSL